MRLLGTNSHKNILAGNSTWAMKWGLHLNNKLAKRMLFELPIFLVINWGGRIMYAAYWGELRDALSRQ
jgi:hypothetical protein